MNQICKHATCLLLLQVFLYIHFVRTGKVCQCVHERGEYVDKLPSMSYVIFQQLLLCVSRYLLLPFIVCVSFFTLSHVLHHKTNSTHHVLRHTHVQYTHSHPQSLLLPCLLFQTSLAWLSALPLHVLALHQLVSILPFCALLSLLQFALPLCAEFLACWFMQ